MRNFLAILLLLAPVSMVQAAIALDRTRIIFPGQEQSVSVTITNENDKLPYLAQAWLEDDAGHKLSGPFVTLPPIQRVPPSTKSQIKIQALPAVSQLPQDRESVFYFNVREIPPKSDKANTLQIALQTRVKLFYRPQAVMDQLAKRTTIWQTELVLKNDNGQYKAVNPTPFYIVVANIEKKNKDKNDKEFESMMVAPFSEQTIQLPAIKENELLEVTYIDDYGGRPNGNYLCKNNACHYIPPDEAASLAKLKK